jgi:SAM-dependent methyltransferase
VLDVAAGTGKLTAALLGRGQLVVAVEPLAGMLAELHRLLPGAGAIAGTAEHLPVADGTVDAVTVAQAFHWFDQRPALDEMARVLRPGGTLALLWNHDDERDPLVRDVEAALDRIGRPAGGSTGRGQQDADTPRTPPFLGHPHLTDPELTEVGWRRELRVEDFIALQHTYSYVIRASDELRARLDVELGGIIRDHLGTADAVTVPVICQVWRSVRR